MKTVKTMRIPKSEVSIMDEKEKTVQAPRELDDEELEKVSGGTMEGNIVIRKTVDLSEDTKKNI